MLKYRFLILPILFCFFISLRGQAFAAEPAVPFKMNFYFDKPSYTFSDSFLGVLYIDNSTTLTARNLRVKVSLVGEVIENGGAQTREIYKESLYQPLFSPGSKKFEFSKKLSGLNLTEGVYPLKAVLTQNSKELASLVTYLVVVNQSEPVYPAAFLFNRQEPVYFDFDRVFLSDRIPLLCRDEAANPGELLAFTQMLAKRNVLINLNLSPALLEQVKMVSGGFRLLDGKDLKKFEASTPEVQGAVKVISNLKNLLGIKKVELLDSPYSGSILPSLFHRKWGNDLDEQLKLTRQALKKSLNPPDKIIGFVPPAYELDEESYNSLKSKYNLLIIKDEQVSKPFREDECLVYPVDVEATRFLNETESPEIAAQGLVALLAQDFLTSPRGQYSAKLVDLSGLELGRLDVLFHYLERTAWLKCESFTGLFRRNYYPGIIKPAPSPESSAAAGYYETMQRTRDFLDFFASAAVNESLINELRSKLLLAESPEWAELEEKPENIGLYYLGEIEKLIKSYFEKIQIIPQEITLSGKTGDIPVAVRNTAGFPFKVLITLSGRDFTFPEGNSKKVVLSPKENVISFKINSIETGSYKLNVSVSTEEGEPVSSGQVTVKSSNLQILLTLLSLIIILAVILFLIKLKIKKKERHPDESSN